MVGAPRRAVEDAYPYGLDALRPSNRAPIKTHHPPLGAGLPDRPGTGSRHARCRPYLQSASSIFAKEL